MTKAIAAGMRFPRTVLGDAHHWLRATFPAPPPPETNGEAAAEAAAVGAEAEGTEQPVGTGAARDVKVDARDPKANGDSAANGEQAVGGLTVAAEGGEGTIADGEAAAAAAATAAAERTRKAWDAVFAPGFEERYEGGGHEHEVCFLAAGTAGAGFYLETPSRNTCKNAYNVKTELFYSFSCNILDCCRTS